VTELLEVSDLRAGYGQIEVLHEIALHVEEGEIVAVLGPNGAGKTTTLLALAGAILCTGSVKMFGEPAQGDVYDRTKLGMAFLPDERGVIRALTVEQNLRLAGVQPAEAFEISPELEVLRNRKGADLSGGEQQILALTRAIASHPKLLLIDEISFGLAPIVVSRMFDLVKKAAIQGAAVVLVEQYARLALEISNRAYVLQRGTVALEGRAADFLADIEALERTYLGAEYSGASES
jgi:branched-chain amino acid transport system ATP-binding protein